MLALALVLLTAAAVFATVTYYTVWVAFSPRPLAQSMLQHSNCYEPPSKKEHCRIISHH